MADKEKLQNMSETELRDEEEKLTDQLFKLRVQKSKGQLENAQRIKVIRRDIARVKTYLRQREIAAEREAEV